MTTTAILAKFPESTAATWLARAGDNALAAAEYALKGNFMAVRSFLRATGLALVCAARRAVGV